VGPTLESTAPLEMASFSLKTGTTFMDSRSSTVAQRFSLNTGSVKSLAVTSTWRQEIGSGGPIGTWGTLLTAGSRDGEWDTHRHESEAERIKAWRITADSINQYKADSIVQQQTYRCPQYLVLIRVPCPGGTQMISPEGLHGRGVDLHDSFGSRMSFVGPDQPTTA